MQKSLDIDPGGDIFIHGGPRYKGEYGKRDWTAGCISVSDKNIKSNLFHGQNRYTHFNKTISFNLLLIEPTKSSH